MQTAKQLRQQAAKLQQQAQYADGPAYHQDMQQVMALRNQADELDNAAKQKPASKATKNTPRSNDLAKIHLLAKKAGLDEDSRRDMMQQISGKRSAAKMTATERGKVINHLQKATKASHFPGKPKNLANSPQLQKIQALLAEAKYPWSYAAAIAKRMHNKDKLEFCSSNELSGVIAALIMDAKKHGRRTA